MQRIATSLPYIELEVATGNYDISRAPIDRIIIHTMVGTWESAAARFDNPASRVSAHYGVKFDGSLIHWLEETFTAYHADNYPINQRSIGIEHEDLGNYNGVRPDVLYTESARLVRDICNFYHIPIDRDHIKKHNEVSDDPTGCPDTLDIDRIVRIAANQPSVSPSSSASASVSPSGSSSASVSPSSSPSSSVSSSPSPTQEVPSPDVLLKKYNDLSDVVYGQWNWFGTNGWYNKLKLLRGIINR